MTMLIELFLGITLLGLLLFLGGLFYYKDRLFLKKKTREALSFAVRKELSVERAENKKKKELFIKTMEQLQSVDFTDLSKKIEPKGVNNENEIKKD